MSRIGRAPISVPPKVQVNWNDSNFVTVKGPKGELSYQIRLNCLSSLRTEQ